jgi:type IV pilus assembly protein PilQ
VFRDYTPLVPNPDVRVEGGVALPANAPLPLPRAIAPPVGDIATGQFIPSPSNTVDLGTAERVPRLVLRDAPAREVLSLLAKAAGLNIVFVGGTGTPQPGQAAPAPGQAADSEGPRVTLDIENELVQNAFNYVLQVTGLEANRIGNTIFVGTRLPNSARNLVVRSLRLNQVPVANALNFLVGLGAESAITRERLVTSVNAIPIQAIGTGGTAPAITQTQTTTEQRVEVQRVAFLDSTPLLRGLQVSGDERTNTMTIIGPARLVDTAISQLLQLDVRRRQVTVNVRVIDVNLNALDQFGTSFSFGIDNSQFLVGAGAALINLGRNAPGSVSIPTTPGNPINPGNGFPTTGFSNSFLLQLQAAIDTQNAKIITDPTLVVQEGQTATVNLTQEVVTNLSQQVTATGDTATVTITAERTPAGLTLPVRIDRIDDNGFISLSVAPSITRPAEEFTLELPGTGGSPGTSGQIVLLSRREVQSGQVRLRDGQTLVLAGIIEEEDRTTVRKVPILGDIPLLGALFRSTSRENLRREVIVLLTPRILDDSQNSGFGYGYTPSPAARELLEREEQRRR